MKIIYDVVIIGGGAGGLFASSTANFFDMKNLIIEQKSYLGGQPLELYPNKYVYDFPCFTEIKSSELIKKLIIQQQNGSGEVLLSTTIKDIKPLNEENDLIYLISTSNKEAEYIYTKNIIIATGNGSFNPRKLTINNIDIEDEFIHYNVKVESDLYKNKKIIVLGGGDSAVDWANYFIEENITDNVTIIHRRDQYRCSSNMINELTKNNVLQKLNYEIVDIDKKEKNLIIKHNESRNVEKIPFDCILVQYGQQSSGINIELFNEIEKYKNKFIVDISQKTNLKHIYAIGDSIYYEYKANTIVTACAEATKCIWHISKNKKRKW